MKRWLPSLPLTVALFVVWLLLNQSLHPATLLTALVLALVVPLLTRSLRPATARMRRPWLALRLTGRVMVDMLESATDIARRLLTRRDAHLSPGFVQMPLQLRDPNGLAVLAMILCLTPGTAWGEVTFDRTMLLIHVFDLQDEEAFISQIRQRYEKPLMEIFES